MNVPSLRIRAVWWSALLGVATLSAADFDLFQDPELSTLLRTAEQSSPTLGTAVARLDQARAAAGVARADFWPQLSAAGSAQRIKSLDTAYQSADYARAGGLMSWEIDLWGRVRHETRAAKAEFRAALDGYALARLSLAAEVTQTHYTLRAAEQEAAVLHRNVETRREALRIIAARTEVGTANPVDLARAEAELAAAEADLAAQGQRAALLRHGLETLVGEGEERVLPTTATTGERSLPDAPTVPGELPSALVRRRPDLQAAQARLDAASERIGVAKAAFFPTLTLTGSAGWESADFNHFLDAGHRVWGFGPSLYLPLFQGGRNRARLSRAEAQFAEQGALYRQAVLQAFREVRDALAILAHTSVEEAAERKGLEAARRSARLSRDRYDAGSASYLEVVDAERNALAFERAVIRVRGQRLVATAALVRALGGAWPAPAAVAAFP